MKKFLGIVVLGFLLSSCSSGGPGTSYQAHNEYYSNYTYHSYACSASNLSYHMGCGMGASMQSQEDANQAALSICKSSDCVVYKEGNRIVYNKQNYENNQNSIKITSMIDKAKNTCKSLGFNEGTEKFTDCSLKLYSQSLDLAAKQNQQVVIQNQGSSSDTVRVIDVTRERENTMRRGLGLINGTCTLANYYNC
jgi:hypothetical protein